MKRAGFIPEDSESSCLLRQNIWNREPFQLKRGLETPETIIRIQGQGRLRCSLRRALSIFPVVGLIADLAGDLNDPLTRRHAPYEPRSSLMVQTLHINSLRVDIPILYKFKHPICFRCRALPPPSMLATTTTVQDENLLTHVYDAHKLVCGVLLSLSCMQEPHDRHLYR